MLSKYAEDEFEEVIVSLGNKGLSSSAPSEAAAAPTSVLISGADQRAFIREGGAIVAEGRAFIDKPGVPLGSHVRSR